MGCHNKQMKATQGNRSGPKLFWFRVFPPSHVVVGCCTDHGSEVSWKTTQSCILAKTPLHSVGPSSVFRPCRVSLGRLGWATDSQGFREGLAGPKNWGATAKGKQNHASIKVCLSSSTSFTAEAVDVFAEKLV